jgi:hypothetical protein
VASNEALNAEIRDERTEPASAALLIGLRSIIDAAGSVGEIQNGGRLACIPISAMTGRSSMRRGYARRI